MIVRGLLIALRAGWSRIQPGSETMKLRSLTQDFYKSVVFPLLLAGALSVTAPVVQGAVDEPALTPPAVSAPITVPLFTQSTSTGSISHLRVINHSTEAGTVSIVAYDDAGSSYGPATLEIDAGEAVHFNAGDLEAGNAEKNLQDGIGTGTGGMAAGADERAGHRGFLLQPDRGRSGERHAGCGAADGLGVIGWGFSIPRAQLGRSAGCG